MKSLNQVWVAPLAFDPGQTLLLDVAGAGSDLDNIARRLGKVRTLDIDVSIIDGGYTEGDRKFRLDIDRPTTEQVNIAQRMIALHPQVRLAKRDGVWLCAPSDIQINGSTMLFTVESIKKVSDG